MNTGNDGVRENGIALLAIPKLCIGMRHEGDALIKLADVVAAEGATVGIETVNWPMEYPYKPEVSATLAHDGEYLFCLFSVKERHLLVRTLDDNGPVWEDSCVELFIADADGRHYYNFETNAAGVSLASRRVSRTECVHFSQDKMRRIIRLSSLPKTTADRVDENGVTWTLLLGIPFDLFSQEIPDMLRINLYKCGDKTETPHFLSWAPINTTAPDFHRPEFFRNVKLS